MTALRLAMLAVLGAAGTMILGWWCVPLLGVVYGAARGTTGKGLVLEAGVGAALGWAAVLASAPPGPLWHLAARAGGVFGLPGWAFVAVTLIFAGLLASTAACLGCWARRGLHLLPGAAA